MVPGGAPAPCETEVSDEPCVLLVDQKQTWWIRSTRYARTVLRSLSTMPIGSRYLLRMVLEVKVLPENGLGGSKDILRMVLDP